MACLYPMHSFVFLYNTCCHCFFLSIDPGLPVSHRHRHHYTVHKGIWYTTPLSMCFCGPFTIVSRNLSDALCHKFFSVSVFSANVSASFSELPFTCNSIHKVGCLSLSALLAVPPVFPRPHCTFDELLWIAILSEGHPKEVFFEIHRFTDLPPPSSLPTGYCV